MRPNRLILSTMLVLSATAAQAGTVKLSFLDEQTAVRGTSEMLLAGGCRPAAVSALKLAIARHDLSPPGFDRAKFPRQVRGFYSFRSISNLLEALPHRLCDSAHPFEFNCFDTVILLGKDLIQVKPQPDAITGPFLPAFTWTNNLTYRDVRATARDAFALSYPSWYIDATKPIMGSIANETRVCLVAAFYCWHALPSASSDESRSATLMRVLGRDWERQGVAFPTNMEVVLCHDIAPGATEVLTSHAGLLFHTSDNYSYIEKAGGSGPFVRLDFKDMVDLRCWLAWEVNGGPNAMPDHRLFVTFNNERIELLTTRQK